jgi:hypothetical protein
MTEQPKPLDRPPSVEEGDNSVAGGGEPASPVHEDELEDAPELDEPDDEDTEDFDEPDA